MYGSGITFTPEIVIFMVLTFVGVFFKSVSVYFLDNIAPNDAPPLPRERESSNEQLRVECVDANQEDTGTGNRKEGNRKKGKVVPESATESMGDSPLLKTESEEQLIL
jgi:hypothetical protein